MNKSVFEQYVNLKAEIKDLEALISKIEASISKMDDELVTDSVSCGRRGKKPIRTVKIQGRPERKIMLQQQRLMKKQKSYRKLQEKLQETIDEIEAVINDVPDSEVRRLLRFRYLQDMSWKDTARMMGKGYTADACRMKIERFLQKM